MTYRILGAPWAGGHTQNPGYVDNTTYVKCLNLATANGCNFVRFNAGLQKGMPPRPTYQHQLFRQMAVRRIGAFIVQQDIYAAIGEVEDVIRMAWHAYDEAGLDPKAFMVYQPGNEYGLGDVIHRHPLKPGEIEGSWLEPDVERIRELSLDVNTMGVPMCSPSFGAESEAVLAREIETTKPLPWRRYDLMGCNGYPGDVQPFHVGAGWRVEMIRKTPWIPGGLPIVITETHQKGKTPAQGIDGCIAGGADGGAGWYTSYDPFDLARSMLKVGPVKK